MLLAFLEEGISARTSLRKCAKLKGAKHVNELPELICI
jgi:hypothetical protein